MIRFLPFLVLCSCASQPSGLNLPKGHDYSLRTLTEASAVDAKKTITNKRNYLLALFEQSLDPYYGTPRWSEACLKANRIGAIQESARGIFFPAHLHLAPTMEPGFCPDNNWARAFHIVVFQCAGSTALMELRVASKGFDESFDWTNLCN